MSLADHSFKFLRFFRQIAATALHETETRKEETAQSAQGSLLVSPNCIVNTALVSKLPKKGAGNKYVDNADQQQHNFGIIFYR